MILFIDKLTISEKHSETLNRCFKHVFSKMCFLGNINKFVTSKKCSSGYALHLFHALQDKLNLNNVII